MTDRSSQIFSTARLQDEALDWILRLTNDDAGPNDVVELERWRAKSPAHADAFANALMLTRKLGLAAESLAPELRATPQRTVAIRSKGRQIARRALLGAGIAAAGAAVIVKPPLGLWPSLSELTADARTSVGEAREMQIADQVQVNLNTRSSIDVIERGRQVRVALVAGEAEFVAAGRPLIAQASDGEISSAQGRFIVRRLASAALVTCLEGTTLVRTENTRSELGENQQVQFSAGHISAARSVDPILVAGWRQGLIVVRSQTVAAAVAEINRYRAAAVIVRGDALRNRRIDAVFHIDRIEDSIAQIVQLSGAQATRLPGGLTILS